MGIGQASLAMLHNQHGHGAASGMTMGNVYYGAVARSVARDGSGVVAASCSFLLAMTLVSTSCHACLQLTCSGKLI